MPQKKFQDIRIRRGGGFPLERTSGKSRTDVKKKTSSHTVRPPRPPKGRRRYSKSALWGLVLVAIIILVASFSSLFERSTIRVVPRTATFPIDATFSAYKDPQPGDLPFRVMTITDSITKEAKADRVEQLDKRATGVIVIYNNYTTQSQRLIKNTRFETSDGRIYRIYDSVIIPGKKEKNGEVVPGSLEITVHADEPGEEYNKEPSDFTIPGFKGTARFDAFYARSKTPIGGGFSGVVKTISEEEEGRIRNELRNALQEKLMEAAAAQAPEEFILFKDSAKISFEEQPDILVEKNIEEEMIKVTEKGTLQGVLFNRLELSNYVARKIVPDFKEGEDVVRIQDIEDNLSFSIQNKDDFLPAEDSFISFALKGEPTFVWQYGEEKLIRALIGQPKNQLENILSEFPSIREAEITIRPFWKRNFPEDPSRILVEQVVK